ncbi:MAG: oligopeptide transport system substrate-binding protein [Planctomycetota bacterium]|jgi:oligopeptide transport system substrate-binding protein
MFAVALAISSSARLEPADFTFNNGAEVSTLDPATVSGVPEGRIVRALFEGLCVKDPKTLEPLPGMAESWEISEDRKTYTFKIREGATWTDGKPVTAYDFEYSWRRMLNPLTAAEYAYQLWYIQGAKQYTLMDDDLEYFSDIFKPFWIKDLGKGRLRVGVSGFVLESFYKGMKLEFQPPLGADLKANDALISTVSIEGAATLRGLPFDCTIESINPELANQVDLVLKDPCGSQWLAEVQLKDLEALTEMREDSILISGERFRTEHVEKRLLGLHAKDTTHFEVTLNAPTPYFLDICAFYPVFPVSRANIELAQEKWPADWELKWLRPENLVTNGPYKVLFRRVNDRIRLTKNESYWDADNVAFDTIDALAIDHLGTSLNLYLMGEIDWIDRPITNVIPRLMPREDFNPTAYLGSYFYRINTNEPPFDDKRVRRALALTIDREAIVLNITKAGEQIAYGFVPPGMGDYPIVEMKHSTDGADYAANFAKDVEEARALLVEAGFGEGGKDFPTFEIHYNTDQTHKDIAEVIADSWKKHLGLNVKLLNQEWKVYLDAQKSLDFSVTRSAWIGDYPDPNTFMDMFVTGGENNRTGWGNLRYDELIGQAAAESDPVKRLEQFAEAEAILMDELAILPIYYYVTRNLVNPRLGGFHSNIQDEHFSKFWYWMDDQELADRRAEQPASWVEIDAEGPNAGKYSPNQKR